MPSSIMNASASVASPLGPAARLRAAIDLPRRSDAEVHAFLDAIRHLARPGPIEVELAMILAWLHGRDPVELGAPNLTAFWGERVDWGATWRKAMIRLVRSPLDGIKQAVCEGRVPLRAATWAPGHVAVEAQAGWIEAQAAGGAPLEDEGARVTLERYEGAEADEILEARRTARICMGRAAADAEVDAWILAHHREETPSEQILVQARERPAPPEPPPPLSWAWCRDRWSEPASVAEAIARMERLQSVLRGRQATVARCWAIALHEALWVDTDCRSNEEFAASILGVSLRQSQRIARIGWGVEWYPELDAAIREGLSLGDAGRLLGIAQDRGLTRWLEVAASVGRLELRRGVAEASAGDGRVLPAYERAMALADQFEAQRATSADPGPGGGVTSADPAPRGGATSDPEARGGATSADPAPRRRLKVALPHAEVPSGRGLRVARAADGLLEAARGWNARGLIRPKRGAAAVKDRDGHRCQNPECGRISLRNEMHHVVWRSLGGEDTPENLITLCRVCHLRGVHRGLFSVEHVEVDGHAALLWRWRDGREVLQLRARPGMGPQGAQMA